MCICIYVYMYMCIYIYIYTRTYLHVYAYIYIYIIIIIIIIVIIIVSQYRCLRSKHSSRCRLYFQLQDPAPLVSMLTQRYTRAANQTTVFISQTDCTHLPMSVNIDIRGEGVRPTLKTSRMRVYLTDTGIIIIIIITIIINITIIVIIIYHIYIYIYINNVVIYIYIYTHTHMCPSARP